MSLALLAGIIGIAGYAPYIRDTLRGSTKPDRASWIIWLLEYVTLFIAQFSVGAGESLWLIGLQLVGVAIICALSLRYGTGGFTKQNAALLVAVCAILVLWYVTQNGSMAILLLLTAEMIGVVLTAKKVYQQPGSETLTMWVLVAVAGALGILAVGANADAILYVYPAALIIMGLGVVAASAAGARKAAFTPAYELID